MLLYLDHESIVRATGVCQFWRNCVAGSKPLLRKIYRLPALNKNDGNPYFDELTETAREAIVPHFEYLGKSLLELVRSIEDPWLDDVHDVPSEENRACLKHEESNYEDTAGYKFYQLRACFMGVRYPDG